MDDKTNKKNNEQVVGVPKHFKVWASGDKKKKSVVLNDIKLAHNYTHTLHLAKSKIFFINFVRQEGYWEFMGYN